MTNVKVVADLKKKSISYFRCPDLTRQNSLVGEIMMSPIGN